jgi:hypothetical protein
MVEKVCSNPECKSVYSIHQESDDGFCCYDCFEKVHCHQPEVVEFEKIEL